MTPDPHLLGRVEITVSHSPLAFIYEFFTPTISINGQTFRRRWGMHSFDLPAGDYEIAISYPWVFAPECGKNSVRLTLLPKGTKRISYHAGLIRYLPGKITVE